MGGDTCSSWKLLTSWEAGEREAHMGEEFNISQTKLKTLFWCENGVCPCLERQKEANEYLCLYRSQTSKT